VHDGAVQLELGAIGAVWCVRHVSIPAERLSKWA